MATPEGRNTHGQDANTEVVATSGHTGLPDPALVRQRLARFMFDLQADDYDADDAMRELAWADAGIQCFWLGQADALVSFLRLDQCA